MATDVYAKGLAGLALMLASQVASAEVITIRADDWLPYNGPTSLKPAGYMIEMAQAIAKANGHSIEYRNLPWDNALEATRSGQVDCVVGAYKSDAEDFMFPEHSWGKSGNVFWVLNETKWRYRGIESLSEIRLGVAESYSYGDELDAYIEANKGNSERIMVVPVIGRAVVRLIARVVGRHVDAFIEDTNVVAYALEQARMEDGRVVSAGEPNEPEDVYIACTPASPRGRELADMFSRGTVELRRSGKLAQILERYNVDDWALSEGKP